MNRLSMAVQTYPAASDALKRHWPYFQRAGADEIIVIGTTDGLCYCPDGIEQEMIGADLYCVSSHLPMRLLRTLQRLRETKADWFCIAEHDVLFLRGIPRDLPPGLTAHLAGGKMPNAHCNYFLHTPWLMDRDTADILVQTGYELLKTKAFDPSPDLFIGHVSELAKVPVHTNLLKGYSRNTIHENHPWIDEARKAIADGAICIHGVKSAEALEQITR